MRHRLLISQLLLFAPLGTPAGHFTDRRVVDTAIMGNSASEAGHGYVGEGSTSGIADGKSYRQTRSYMQFSLGTFDDTEVTVACILGGVKVESAFDLVVEDSVVATRAFSAPTSESMVLDFVVPFALTKGKTSISIVIRARGGVTPALREIRTIQDHLEQDDHADVDIAPVSTAISVSASPSSPNLSGVVR